MDVRYIPVAPWPQHRAVRVLILGGTLEARALSQNLVAFSDVEAIVSLAGRTSEAVPQGGTVRVGGFGGTQGLARFLIKERIDALVDATHPFAAQMSQQAAGAAALAKKPCLHLVRPAWQAGDGDRWTEVADLPAATQVLYDLSVRRVLLTIGRTELSAFSRISGVHFVIRTIEPAPRGEFADAAFIEERGPFTVADEHDLLLRHRIRALVTKNSGGDDAKLVAARAMSIPVVMVRRPPPPAGPAAHNPDEAVRWLKSLTDL